MKRKKALSILLAAALVASAAGCGGGGGDASSTTAVEMRVQRQVGTVTLSNEKGENVTLIEKMRLNAGHNLDTAKESFVAVSMDETKMLTLEENGGASVVQKGGTLQFEVKKGNALVSLTEELKDGQAVEVRSGNMICGIRGTTLQSGKDENGDDTVLVAETGRTDGVEVRAVDNDGKEIAKVNAQPGQRVTYKHDNLPGLPGQTGSGAASGGSAASQSGSGSVLETSDCSLEDFTSTSLISMAQNPNVLEKVSNQLGIQVNDAKELASLLSQSGSAGDGSQDAPLPLFGDQAQIMQDAAKATKETTGKEMQAELAILRGTRNVMDAAKAQGLSGTDMANVAKNANEQMNGLAKAAINAGAQGDNLAELAKVTSGQILEVAGVAIEGGLSAGDINGLTNASGEGFSRIFTSGGTGGLQAANYDAQRALNQIKAEVSRQQSSTDSLRQLLRERSGDAGARNNEQAMAMLRNGLSGQNAANGGNAANVTPVPAPTPTPAPTSENETPPASNDDDDDDDDYYVQPTQPTQPTQPAVTTYAINKKIVLFYRGEDVGGLQNVKSQLVSINYAGATGDRAVAGSNVTIAVNEKNGVNVIGLQAGQGDNTLYPRLYYEQEEEPIGLWRENASGQKEYAEVKSINITMPAGDITATASIEVSDRVVYGWDENTISSVVLPTGAAVSPGDYIPTQDISSITVNTKPEANATYVHYVTINGDNDATDLRVANNPETHSCQIPIDTSPILHIYTNTD